MDADSLVSLNVRRLRDERGMTQGEMAEAVGLSRTAYLRIETGERRIEAAMLLACAAALNVAPVWLLAPWEDEVLTVRDVDLEPSTARAWVRGRAPLPDADPRLFHATVPLAEYQPPRSADD